jgi:hypothetical protein
MRIWSFIGGVILAYVISFVGAFAAVGLAWDPRRMRLLSASPQEIWELVVQAFVNAPWLAVTSFNGAHPVVVTMGLGFVVLLAIGLIGLGEKAGRRTVYGIAAILAALGVVRFFFL